MTSTAAPSRSLPTRILLLLVGCVVLGLGVGMLLVADVGSDGFSTLVNGVARAVGMPFWVANLIVASAFVALAALRRVRPGPGTVLQIVLVGLTVDLFLQWVPTPAGWPGRVALLVAAFPVLATGIAVYLGSHTGAGPAESVGLAWDPPIPFKFSYSLVQFGGALVGWLLGATIGVGTVAVVLVLGPLVDLVSRSLRIDVHQAGARERDRGPE